MPESTDSTFTSFAKCSAQLAMGVAEGSARVTAGVAGVSLVLGGSAVQIAGSVATLGLMWPGLAIGCGVSMVTGDFAAGGAVTLGVTYSVYYLGVGMVKVGMSATECAAYGCTTQSQHTNIQQNTNRTSEYMDLSDMISRTNQAMSQARAQEEQRINEAEHLFERASIPQKFF